MSFSADTPNWVDEDTRKTLVVMDLLRTAMHAETDPAVRAEIQDEMGCVALSWFICQMKTDNAD
ncbi:hypothetical protein [Prosthecobacter fluviatilis]|uniref:Uncharacterized protein n=1 Tax=Prosthecobacter fluviatilis TaxID=445931 RepID=A0ABW0KTN4_9BACT